MRSQQEILEKINRIEETASDPQNVQLKCLIRKLSWDNAVSNGYINKKYLRDIPEQIKWKETSLLDKGYLMKEFKNVIDEGFSACYEESLNKVIAMCQIALVYVWFLGNKHTKLISELVISMQYVYLDYGKLYFKKLCEEFGFNFELFEKRYKSKN